MDFVANQKEQIDEMLKVIGVDSIDALFAAIPSALRRARPTEDDGLSEFEGLQLMEALSKENRYLDYDAYLGGGAYEHHVPAIVSAICSKSEFMTSYTPYQAEISQGMLQAIFEFQSAVCALTGMDVSNASVYDAASACAEAALMALRQKKGRSKILMAKTVHPHVQSVVKLYTEGAEANVVIIDMNAEGLLCETSLLRELDEKAACLLLQSPNFLGAIEDVTRFRKAAEKCGALTILSANPMSFGIYASGGDLGVDIVAGDMQPFGLPLQFGGPYAGYLACKQELLRQLPGRIVGETVDTEGSRGFVLTLQAREQHIRRDKATSNICTNQALAALACLVGVLWYGKQGVRDVALANFKRASYLREELKKLPHVTVIGPAPIFNEFAVRFDAPSDRVQSHFAQSGILPGVPLGGFSPELADAFLVAATETKTVEQLDRYVDAAKGVVS